jgi:hypothetical protein
MAGEGGKIVLLREHKRVLEVMGSVLGVQVTEGKEIPMEVVAVAVEMVVETERREGMNKRMIKFLESGARRRKKGKKRVVLLVIRSITFGTTFATSYSC